jgi:hypothetical protein
MRPYALDLELARDVPFRGRPDPPRNLRASPGTMEVLIYWNAPACSRSVDGFRVYQGNEYTQVWKTDDPAECQVRIKLPANTTDVFFVSCVSRLGRDSPKIPVYATSNSDKYVVSGTSGETAETGAQPGAEWAHEPTGGGRRRLRSEK